MEPQAAHPSHVVVRAATSLDAPTVARIWEQGWSDGHLGHVPDELVAIRTPESFRERAAHRVADTIVGLVDGEVGGFVIVVDDEVEQVYVDRSRRGTGLAARLLAAAESRAARNGHARAWLAVATGNLRARRFYERCGWHDDGPLAHRALEGAVDERPGGIVVDCHRYVREVRLA